MHCSLTGWCCLLEVFEHEAMDSMLAVVLIYFSPTFSSFPFSPAGFRREVTAVEEVRLPLLCHCVFSRDVGMAEEESLEHVPRMGICWDGNQPKIST